MAGDALGARPQLAAGGLTRSVSVRAALNASSLRRVREQSLKNQRSLIGTKSRVRMPV